MNRKKYGESEFNKLVRIKEKTYEKVKEIKHKKSIAGKIDEIIQYYLDNKKL